MTGTLYKYCWQLYLSFDYYYKYVNSNINAFFLKKYQIIWLFDILFLILHIDKRRVMYMRHMLNLKLLIRNRHK